MAQRADSVPNALTVGEGLRRAGVRAMLLSGEQPGSQSIQVLVKPADARTALQAVEPLPWRYSWIRSGLLRLLPEEYFWWDGGFELEVLWGLIAAPMPSATLGRLERELWATAVEAADGMLRPDPAALLVHRAVQACRAPFAERDWEGFVRLRSSTRDLTAARDVSRRTRVSRALTRALAAADAGGGPPRPGQLLDGPLAYAWTLATGLQSRAPRRLSRLLAGAPSLGDASIRCRFGGIEVLAGPGVFVPTPDADIFIEMGIERMQELRSPVVIDVGTGCGAIALALAGARPDAEVHAMDLSAPAIRWARRSASRSGLERVSFYAGPLLDPAPAEIEGRVDLILANLPFYPSRDYASIGSVPRDTIQGQDDDGLGLLRRLARQARQFLRPGGTLILQMFAWQWDIFSGELEHLGYRPGTPRSSDPFAICPATLMAADGS
jgi:methylase of polypeptide subunit release factors